MKFLEKDLESLIFGATKEALKERGLPNVYKTRKRQVKIGNYGIADIITWNRHYETPFGEKKLRIEIFELKQDKISVSAVLQVIRYCKGVIRYFQKRGLDVHNLEINMNVIGKSIDTESDIVYLPEIFAYNYNDFNPLSTELRFYTYDFDFEKGLNFKSIGNMVLANEGF